MQVTDYSRKMDSMGRLMIPVKLREQFNLPLLEEYPFYVHEENGDTYICIKCPHSEALEQAKELLRKHGYKV